MKSENLPLRPAATRWAAKLTLGLAGLIGGVAALAASQASAATVVNFDDLTGNGTLADGYHGITWNGAWNYYDSPQYPYTPASGLERIFNNSIILGPPTDAGFSFSAPVVFNGAAFSGYPNTDVSFDLYLGATLVHTSSSLAPTSTPAFLSSGYSGLVDRVVIRDAGPADVLGSFVVDNVTFGPAGSVVEPAAWAMLLVGFTGLGALLRSRRNAPLPA
jgi:hypothetical protein